MTKNSYFKIKINHDNNLKPLKTNIEHRTTNTEHRTQNTEHMKHNNQKSNRLKALVIHFCQNRYNNNHSFNAIKTTHYTLHQKSQHKVD